MAPLSPLRLSPLLGRLLSENRVWFARGSSAPVSSSQMEAQFGIEAIDSLHALPFGHLHEWSFDNRLAHGRSSWYPPTALTCSVLGETLGTHQALLRQKSLVAWIGRRVWPTPHFLEQTLPQSSWCWRSHTMFLDPHDKEERLWAVVQLLSSPALFAVFADGSGLNFIATRRLQLAAQKHNALCFLFRPPWELERVSCAHSRWRVTPVEGFREQHGEVYERWNVELVSGKGLPTPLSWELERKSEPNRLHLAERLDGSGTEQSGSDTARKFA